MGKNLNLGARASWSSILVILLIAVVRVTVALEKSLKETETKETIGFVSPFLSLIAFQYGGAGALGPLVTPMVL